MCPSRTAKNSGVNPETSEAPRVGPGGDERLDDAGVPFGRGPHERGLPAPLTGGGVCAVGQKRLDGREASRARRGHEDGLATEQPRVRVGAGVEQQTDQVGVPVRRRQCERCRTP